jgi:nitrate/TMAO reductase-like tetraheme cytochrome c subunit
VDRLCAVGASNGFSLRLFAVVVLATYGVMVGSAEPMSAQEPDVNCEKCHGDSEFVLNIEESEGHTFLVPDSILGGTAHGDLSCSDCHEPQTSGYPHSADLEAVDCASCHEDEGLEWSGSIHAANAMEGGEAPDCVTCHSAHRVLLPDDIASPTNVLNVAGLCAGCHADAEIIDTYFAGPENEAARSAVERYHRTVHGTAVDRGGLVVSATCNDCHGAHLILPADSVASTVNRANISATCRQCHEIPDDVHRNGERDGIGEDGNPRVYPECIDCHTGHSIVRTDETRWFVGLAEECGSCHERVYETYFDTYHGQVTRLGFGLTAKCSDCHTAHNVHPASVLESSVSPVNLVETCRTCHENANGNFVQYYTHGDMRDRVRYPVLFWPWLLMTTLLVSVWSFFGLHSLLWLNRALIERKQERKRLLGHVD